MARSLWRLRAPLVVSLLFPVFALAQGTAALSPEIRSRISAECRRQHPNLIQDYLARQACISDEERREAEAARIARIEEQRRQREAAARPCIQAALPSLESVIHSARASINPNMSLSDAQRTLDSILPARGTIQVSNSDIRENVYVNTIRPSCDTSFAFLVNVDTTGGTDVFRFRVWAQNPPSGYRLADSSNGFIDMFFRDFARERFQELARQADEERRLREAQAAEERRRQQAAAAEQERQRQAEIQRRVTIARPLMRLSNVNIECPYLTSTRCDHYRISVSVRNSSREMIQSIRFGFSFVPSNDTTCPASLAPRVTRALLLAPGEVGTFSWGQLSDSGLPAPPGDRQFRVCVTIEGIEIRP